MGPSPDWQSFDDDDDDDEPNINQHCCAMYWCHVELQSSLRSRQYQVTGTVGGSLSRVI